MNKDTVQGNFTQLKGKIKQHWGKLTDDDLEREEAERQAKEFRKANNWN